MKGELVQDVTEELKERLKAKCSNLSDEALDMLSIGMVSRITENHLSTQKEKIKRLFDVMKGGL